MRKKKYVSIVLDYFNANKLGVFSFSLSAYTVNFLKYAESRSDILPKEFDTHPFIRTNSILIIGKHKNTEVQIKKKKKQEYLNCYLFIKIIKNTCI